MGLHKGLGPRNLTSKKPAMNLPLETKFDLKLEDWFLKLGRVFS